MTNAVGIPTNGLGAPGGSVRVTVKGHSWGERLWLYKERVVVMQRGYSWGT